MKKILTGLVVVLALVLVGGRCNKEGVTQMTGGLTGKTTEPEKTQAPEGWLKFQSETHKFSFWHPAEWKVEPEIDREDLLTMRLVLVDQAQAERENELTGDMMPCEYWITVRVEDNPENLPAKDFGVKQYISESREKMKAKLKDYQLNGVKGYLDSGPVTPPSSGDYHQVSLAPENGKAYSLVYYAAAHQKTHEKYLEEFYQIIESLEFEK